MTLRILAVGGARPNFMKLAPLWYEAQRLSGAVEFEFIHTGQHSDELMSSSFLRDLKLPTPNATFELTSKSPADQIGEMISKLAEPLSANRPDVLIVVGDVNSTVAAAIAGNKSRVPVAHVEAGLRSFDRSMPEEINRLVIDQIADVLLASEPTAIDNLRKEGIAADRCHLVGNLMIDCLLAQWSEINSLSIDALLASLHVGSSVGHPARYGVMTAHRPSNVDCRESLAELLQICRKVTERIPLVWPMHPRTMHRLEETEMMGSFRSTRDLFMTTPLTYHRFMKLVSESAMVITDSGGIQEETTFLGVPCITIRDNTERPLTTTAGTNRLCRRCVSAVDEAMTWALCFDRRVYSPPPLWDGKAAHRTLQVLLRH